MNHVGSPACVMVNGRFIVLMDGLPWPDRGPGDGFVYVYEKTYRLLMQEYQLKTHVPEKAK